MILTMNRVRRACGIKHPIVRESLAELIGTATLVFFGDAAIANNKGSNVGSTVNVPLGYATALALAVYVSGGVSGGHVNPCVTMGMCLTGRCDLNRLLPFTIAQFIGAFLGAALTHGLFFDVFQLDLARSKSMYGVFATYPNPIISTMGAFLDQTMGTAMLLFGIMAVTDAKNMKVPKGGIPACIGLVLFGVITASGSNTGAALNPARDFSPRLYSYIIGYDNVFTEDDNFFWIPIVACYVGCVIGAFLYFFCIEVHHPAELKDAEEQDVTTVVEPPTSHGPAGPAGPAGRPAGPAGRPDSAPELGQRNGGFRDDADRPRSGGYPRDPGYPKDSSYPRDPSYPRGPAYPRNESFRDERYM